MSNIYSSPEDTLRYALEHLLEHYLSNMGGPLEDLWGTAVVQHAVSALKSVGVYFKLEQVNNAQHE